MLALYFGNWQFWDTYNPTQSFGTDPVVFEGITRTIYVNEGVTELDVGRDIYSAWKRWIVGNVENPNASAWPEAIAAIGGEAITDIQSVGSTFFLENGWRIQPYSSDNPYVLNIVGNLYTREIGGNPVLGAQNASVSLTRSNLVDLITPESALTETDRIAVAQYVWDYLTTNDLVSGSYGELVQEIRTAVEDTLKRGEFLALQE